jgi:hypothetical protein
MIDVNRCTLTIALAHARVAVRQGLRDRGEKVNLVALSVIQRMAKEYLVEHPALIDEARPIAEEMHQQHQRKLAYQRELRAIRKRLAQAQPKSSTTPKADSTATAYSEIDR